MTTVTPKEATKAANLIDGMIAHPSWKGIDRDALTKVSAALRDGSINVEEPDEEIPRFGLPGDVMVFTNRGGYDMERERAASLFDLTQKLVISATRIGRSSSRYEFVGFPHSYNTVMFDYADPAAIQKDWDDNRLERKQRINACNEYVGYDIYELD